MSRDTLSNGGIPNFLGGGKAELKLNPIMVSPAHLGGNYRPKQDLQHRMRSNVLGLDIGLNFHHINKILLQRLLILVKQKFEGVPKIAPFSLPFNTSPAKVDAGTHLKPSGSKHWSLPAAIG